MTIRSVVERHGHFAHGGDPDSATETWSETGLTPEEVDEWLAARCFAPDAARDLADTGITPAMAGMRTSAGAGNYTDTIAFKVSDGDLGVDEARELVAAV